MNNVVPHPDHGLSDVAPTPDSAGPAAVADTPPVLTGPLRLRRLSVGLALVYVAILAINSGGLGILIPNLVADLDAANKIGNLAIVTTVAFLANVFAQPIAGALSDATRSRFGRRSPWMIGGALLAGGFVLGLPLASSVVMVAVIWLVVQLGLNALQAAATALVPDRFPAAKRGGVSGMIGLGITVGNAAGAVIAGSTVGSGALPYVVLAVLLLVIVALFVVVNPDRSSRDDVAAPRQTLGEFLRGFWVDPRKHPDFAWAFAARFLMVIGFYGAQTFGLYILRDYIGLSDEASNGFAAQIGIVLLLGVLISALTSGVLSDRIGRRKPFIVWASVIMAIGLAVPLVLPTTTGILIYSFLLGLGFGAYISIDLALMTEVLPVSMTSGASTAGRDLAILGLATTLPQALSPSIAAGLVSLTGGYPVLFVSGIVFVVLGALAVIPIKSVR
ncbi:MFS transporter [Rathayibacter sp. VKM Ac-2926]|uniref:MFS transporter n=1 Tax=Rathayibacter sp. VKM Ac-2926 TaxID=2929477 RepID=UPI001FB272DD|nr:MFS transporter [Rathayibacter sp. VKM Ac-2926]MCJ1702981.1 MFS transporter [Rathayibacter sp. VKM Ac-2926]